MYVYMCIYNSAHGTFGNISNCSSDYYVGIALIQNGSLYVGYRNTHPKRFVELYQMHIYRRKVFTITTLEVLLTFVEVEKLIPKTFGQYCICICTMYIHIIDTCRTCVIHSTLKLLKPWYMYLPVYIHTYV